MSFSEDNHLTPAGEAFVFGYLTNSAPDLAAKAVEALKAMEADFRAGPPGYWIKTPVP